MFYLTMSKKMTAFKSGPKKEIKLICRSSYGSQGASLRHETTQWPMIAERGKCILD